MDLFDSLSTNADGTPVPLAGAPLAVRMRPQSLEEVVGQEDLVQPGSPLRNLIEFEPQSGTSVVLWGPPGCGKTTFAYLVAQDTQRTFRELSAINASVKDVREIIAEAKRKLSLDGSETVLFIDEVHRFSKTQQDSLLPAVENGWVTLIAATTENPAFSVISPLLSRSLVLHLNPLNDDAIRTLLERALSDERGLAGKFTCSAEASEAIVALGGSDGRKALTILEAASETARRQGRTEISAADVKAANPAAIPRYNIDEHYDVASAFIKSMRGSDPDAAVYYLARMLAGGEDPRFVARRIMICAAEDVGMAAPEILPIATAAAQAVALVGMPEARIILAEAVIAVATAPKSNRAYQAINKAMADVEAGKNPPVPQPLRDQHYPHSGNETGKYLYAHDFPHAIAPQQYLPDELEGTQYYQPTTNGFEAQITERLAKVRQYLKMR